MSGNTLYGTTDMGGNYDGVVFKLNTDGSGYTVLKNFNCTMALLCLLVWSWWAAHSTGQRVMAAVRGLLA